MSTSRHPVDPSPTSDPLEEARRVYRRQRSSGPAPIWPGSARGEVRARFGSSWVPALVALLLLLVGSVGSWNLLVGRSGNAPRVAQVDANAEPPATPLGAPMPEPEEVPEIDLRPRPPGAETARSVTSDPVASGPVASGPVTAGPGGSGPVARVPVEPDAAVPTRSTSGSVALVPGERLSRATAEPGRAAAARWVGGAEGGATSAGTAGLGRLPGLRRRALESRPAFAPRLPRVRMRSFAPPRMPGPPRRARSEASRSGR